jgi:hypothetical protein
MISLQEDAVCCNFVPRFWTLLLPQVSGLFPLYLKIFAVILGTCTERIFCIKNISSMINGLSKLNNEWLEGRYNEQGSPHLVLHFSLIV